MLQQLESPQSQDVSVNDAFRPVSRYWDRINRPEQLVTALPEAMRVLTSPAETGAVTLALPAGRAGGGLRLSGRAVREARVARPAAGPGAGSGGARRRRSIRSAKRPLIVAGGGVLYSEATAALRALAAATGIPVGETQAGKGALRYDDPLALGAIGVDRHARARTSWPARPTS